MTGFKKGGLYNETMVLNEGVLLDSSKIKKIASGNKDVFKALMLRMKDEERRRFLHYRPYSKQLEFHNSFATERILSGANQSGKSQPLDELVLTPSGWVKMGDIRVGDYVIGSDGEAKRVLEIHPQGLRDIYLVEFQNNASVRCDVNHLWSLKSKRGLQTYTAMQCKDMLKSSSSRLITPQVQEVRFNISTPTIDPYLMGLLLGDGGLSNNGVVITNIDEEIINYCKNIANDYDCTLTKSNEMSYRFTKNDKTKGCNGLYSLLRDFDLVGIKSRNKYVPDVYKFNSIETRLEVLRGLIDTDGSIDKDGGIEFYSVSKRLCQDVYDIAMSLGIRASIRLKRGKYKGQPHFSWRVNISKSKYRLSNLKRKYSRQVFENSQNNGIGIKNITEAGKVECQCITIDSKDSLYVTKDFILTHNSLSGCMETCFHLTGNYPDWWDGHRIKPRINASNGNEEINIWVVGTDSKTVRDSLQSKIIGTEARGFVDGSIHPDFIDKDGCITSRGVKGLIDTIYVKHASGCMARLQFRSYEQGRENLQSATIDAVYCDEEPPSEVIGELRARIGATGGFMYMAFTPLKGMTPLVQEFWTKDNIDKKLVCMNIYEAKHYTEEKIRKIESLYSGLSESERKARMMGIPTMGSGTVFPVEDEEIKWNYEGYIPEHWKRLYAIDFGRGEHPFACVWGALDTVNDVLYIYDCLKVRNKTAAELCSMIKSRGDWIIGTYPHDFNRDSGVGGKYKEIYKKEGLLLTKDYAKDKDGSNKVENGLIEMRQRMFDGRFKVASHLSDWFSEKQVYRYGDDGKPVKEKDDLLDATRYLTVMLRYAKSENDYLLDSVGRFGNNNICIDNTPYF